MKSLPHQRRSMYDGTAPANWPTRTTQIFKLPHAQQQDPSLVSAMRAGEPGRERPEALLGESGLASSKRVTG
jgi:hypothetical protein